MNQHAFDGPAIDAVYRAIRERRDMRHFVATPIDPDLLRRLIGAAHAGPSVGLMQPWRFLKISDPALRQQLHQHVDEERGLTAQALGQRADQFMRLKVEGMRECAELLVVALMNGRDTFVFGRRTMPQMDLASASCAIQNFWLAARAEGSGVGWVSLFDPQRVRELCAMPADSLPIAILCVGHVDEFYAAPMLEMQGWQQRRAVADVVYENTWGNAAA